MKRKHEPSARGQTIKTLVATGMHYCAKHDLCVECGDACPLCLDVEIAADVIKRDQLEHARERETVEDIEIDWATGARIS